MNGWRTRNPSSGQQCHLPPFAVMFAYYIQRHTADGWLSNARTAPAFGFLPPSCMNNKIANEAHRRKSDNSNNRRSATAGICDSTCYSRACLSQMCSTQVARVFSGRTSLRITYESGVRHSDRLTCRKNANTLWADRQPKSNDTRRRRRRCRWSINGLVVVRFYLCFQVRVGGWRPSALLRRVAAWRYAPTRDSSTISLSRRRACGQITGRVPWRVCCRLGTNWYRHITQPATRNPKPNSKSELGMPVVCGSGAY